MIEYKVINDSVVEKESSLYAGGSLFVSSLRKSDSAVRISRLIRGNWTSTTLRTAAASDIHDAPSIAVGPDGYIYAVSETHGSQVYDVPVYRSDEPYGITFTQVSTISVDNYFKYPYIVFDDSGTLWLFHANGNQTRNIVYRKSNDGGETWFDTTTLWDSANGDGDIPYFTVHYTDGEILITTSSDNSSEDMTSGCYFMKHDGTSWKKADGTEYTLPVTKTTADVAFNPATAGGSAGFSIRAQKDSSGRYFCIVPRFSEVEDEFAGVYLCRYDSGWSQTLIDADMNSSSVAVRSNGLYEFIGTKKISSVVQLARWTSENDGEFWYSEVLTSGSLNRERGFIRHIEKFPSRLFVIYEARDRVSNFTWDADAYLLFSALTNRFQFAKGGWAEQAAKSIASSAWGSSTVKRSVGGAWQ